LSGYLGIMLMNKSIRTASNICYPRPAFMSRLPVTAAQTICFDWRTSSWVQMAQVPN